MPICVECGVEAARAEMFGAADDLRCAACAQKRRKKYVGPRFERERIRSRVSLATMIAAAALTAGYWVMPDWTGQYLIAAPSAIWRGAVWRFATTTLLHASFLHLAFNLYMFWRFGVALETWLGTVRYGVYLLLLSFGSMATEFLATAGSAVGLSGVVYGMFGTLYALRRTKGFAAEVMQPSLVQTMVGWFVLCIVLTEFGVMPVANVAHGAGAGLGWVIGVAATKRRRTAYLALLGLATVLVVGATQWMPWDGRFDRFQAEQAARRGDDEAARLWFERAIAAPRHGWDARRGAP